MRQNSGNITNGSGIGISKSVPIPTPYANKMPVSSSNIIYTLCLVLMSIYTTTTRQQSIWMELIQSLEMVWTCYHLVL